MQLAKFWRFFDEEIASDWSENKLVSRKWWLVFSVVYIAIAADLFGHELGANTTQIVTIVVPAFVTMQGFVDMIKYRVARKRQWWLDEKEKRDKKEGECK